MAFILTAFVLFFVIRLCFLAISIKNEKKLIARGATQVGATTSKVLAAAHIVYYFLALYESYQRGWVFDTLTVLGSVIVGLSLVVLAYIIKLLGAVWTVKVYILPNHPVSRAWLFKTFRHPNYFLNIIPELIGMALLCHAWTTFLIGLPIYLVILGLRIYQEEQAMRQLLAPLSQ